MKKRHEKNTASGVSRNSSETRSLPRLDSSSLIIGGSPVSNPKKRERSSGHIQILEKEVRNLSKSMSDLNLGFLTPERSPCRAAKTTDPGGIKSMEFSPSKFVEQNSPQRKMQADSMLLARQRYKKQKKSPFRELFEDEDAKENKSANKESEPQRQYSDAERLLIDFEHKFIYLRRFVDYPVENVQAQITKLLQVDLLEYVNALVTKTKRNARPSLPSDEKLAGMQADLRMRFGEFKTLVRFFKAEHDKIVSALLPDQWQAFNPTFTSHLLALVNPFVTHLDELETIDQQIEYCKISENLECVILLANENKKMRKLCLMPAFDTYWASLIEGISNDLKMLLTERYTEHYNPRQTSGIDPNHPFLIVRAMYFFCYDLKTMSANLNAITDQEYLREFDHHQWYDTFLKLMYGEFIPQKTKDEILNLYYVQTVSRRRFYDLKELDFELPKEQVFDEETRSAVVEPFKTRIANKPFGDLMWTFFRKYTRLLVDYFKLAEGYEQVGAMRYVSEAVSKIVSLSNPRLLRPYLKHGLEFYENFNRSFLDAENKFFRIIKMVNAHDTHFNPLLLIDARSHEELIKCVKKYELSIYDENIFIDIVNRMQGANAFDDFDLDAVNDYLEAFENIDSLFDSIISDCRELIKEAEENREQVMQLRGNNNRLTDQLYLQGLALYDAKISKKCDQIERLVSKCAEFRRAFGIINEALWMRWSELEASTSENVEENLGDDEYPGNGIAKMNL